eukprot:13377765-Ditylum_brightwellii.AAC.2
MLGIIKTATLDKSEELDYLLDKTTTYTKATSACPLHPHEMWLGHTTVYKPCIIYPLSTTSFDKTQFSGGIGLMHVSAAQLGAKVCRAIKHVQAQTKMGKTFIMMTWWEQISA